MECHEVFSVSSSISLLRPRLRTTKVPALASPSQAAQIPTTTLPAETRDELPRAFASDSAPNSLRLPEISFVKPNCGGVLDEGSDYVDINLTADAAATDVGSGPMNGEGRKKRGWMELCYCKRHLLPIKIFYFAFIGALGVILPYASVFLKQLGLSAFQIGVISGIRPALGFVSGPLWGAVADRFRIRRVLMLVSVLAWLGFFVGLYFIPPAPRSASCPGDLPVAGKRDDAWFSPGRAFRDLGANESDVLETTTNAGRFEDSNFKRTGEFYPTTEDLHRKTVDSNSTTIDSASMVESSRSSTEIRLSLTDNSKTIMQAPIPSMESLNQVTEFSNSSNSENSNPASEVLNRTSLQSDSLHENRAWLYEPEGLHRVFVTSLLIICGGELFQAPTTAISDAATLETLGREGLEQYGAQRAWGPVGWAISSLTVGALLSAGSTLETVCGVQLAFSDYRLVAYVFIGIMVFAFAAALQIDFSVGSDSEGKAMRGEGEKSQEKSSVHNTWAIFKFFLNVHYGSWIATAFYVGICNGVIWGFLFWHLDNLGASQLLMGVDSVVACVFEFAAFFIVEHVIKYVGHMGIMYIGLAGYVIRFCIYASLVNPWYVLPAEALQGITFSFIWVSLTSYSAVAVPAVSLATIQGIIHGVYFGLGNGLGHFLGGVIIGAYGAPWTFYGLAIVTAAWLLMFAIMQKLSVKPTNQFDYQDMADACDAKSETSGRR